MIADFIAAATTGTRLKVCRELDPNSYPKDIAVTNAEMVRLNIQRADFHGEWNYRIAP
ncbi:MAG: ISAzo13-like element transposase-related protein [Methylocella sp.]